MPGCRRTRRYYSLAQARQMILDDSDVEVDNVVVIPPENKGDVTDDEENDEGSAMPVDVPGEVEVDYIATESSADNSSSSESESHASTSAKKRRQQTKTRTCRETKSRISKSEETEECDKCTTNKMPQRKQLLGQLVGYILKGSGIYYIGTSAYGSSKDRKWPLGYQPNTPTSCST